jgi:hypothetical protein
MMMYMDDDDDNDDDLDDDDDDHDLDDDDKGDVDDDDVCFRPAQYVRPTAAAAHAGSVGNSPATTAGPDSHSTDGDFR